MSWLGDKLKETKANKRPANWKKEATRNPQIQAWWHQLQDRHPDLKNVNMIKMMENQSAKDKLDGYNYIDAINAGAYPTPTEDGSYHWSSLNPETGEWLKGPLHPTAHKQIFLQGDMSTFMKKLFASTETSGDISGDYLQLEKGTFKDLKQRKRIPANLKWEDLVDPETYDNVAVSYLKDLMTTFKIPTMSDAVLWSWRPGWYRKYRGDINSIPEDEKVNIDGKMVSSREVMENRLHNMEQFLQGELKSRHEGNKYIRTK